MEKKIKIYMVNGGSSQEIALDPNPLIGFS
jgi:hypothetical protein